MPTVSTALDLDILTEDLPIDTKCEILNAVWGARYSVENFYQDPLFGRRYLRYYVEQCDNALHSKALNMSLQTHRDIVEVIQQLSDPNKSRQDLKQYVKTHLADPEVDGVDNLVGEIIDLAVRLWLMIDVGKLQRCFVPGQRPVTWDEGGLQRLVRSRFASAANFEVSPVRVKLDRIFTARNLEQMAGLQIVWIDNLADHLKLTLDDTAISIYHHATVLEHHKSNPIFPQGFIDETLRTLALLFPRHDKKARKWFQSQHRRHDLDPRACAWGHLTTEERQIGNFAFWRDRLAILKQVFDEAEPKTISQWWRDRRRPVQWYTFWVAITVLALTIFFGMVQSIEGGFQVYKAYNPS